MGSIPPAASIEYPQRELVALIAASGLTPDNADLAQLLKAIKLVDVMNIFKMGTNGGSASQWSMACPALPIMPPPLGTAVWFKPGLASVNGGTLFSLNGSALLPVVNCDLSPIAIGDIVPSAWLLLFFDGAHWQVLAGSTRQFGALPLLLANTDWYVNGTTGDDAAYDGTAATHTGGIHGPFKTLQRAANETLKYNMNGYHQFVHVADNAYAAVALSPTNGTGVVHFLGNSGSPANCAIFAGTPNIAAIGQNGGYYTFNGFRLSAVGAGASDGIAISGGSCILTNMQFGPCTRFHMTYRLERCHHTFRRRDQY